MKRLRKGLKKRKNGAKSASSTSSSGKKGNSKSVSPKKATPKKGNPQNSSPKSVAKSIKKELDGKGRASHKSNKRVAVNFDAMLQQRSPSRNKNTGHTFHRLRTSIA